MGKPGRGHTPAAPTPPQPLGPRPLSAKRLGSGSAGAGPSRGHRARSFSGPGTSGGRRAGPQRVRRTQRPGEAGGHFPASFRLQGKRAPISTWAFAGSAAGHTRAHPGAWPSPGRQRPPSAGVTGRGRPGRQGPGSGRGGAAGGGRGAGGAAGGGARGSLASGAGGQLPAPSLDSRPPSGAPPGLAESRGGPRTSWALAPVSPSAAAAFLVLHTQQSRPPVSQPLILTQLDVTRGRSHSLHRRKPQLPPP